MQKIQELPWYKWWCSYFTGKTTSHSVGSEIPCLWWNLKDHPHIHQVYHQTASSASSIQHTYLHFISPYSVHVNTTLPSLPRCLKRLSWGTLTKTAYAFLTSCTCCITHLVQPPQHNHPHNNKGRVSTMKPIICNFLNPLT